MTPEEARKILADRAARDPLRHLTLTPTQLAFRHALTRHRLIEGGNRKGKTTVRCADSASVLRNMHPVRSFGRPIRMLLLTKSRLQMAEVVGRKLFKKSEVQGPMGQFPLIPDYEIDELGHQKIGGIEVPYYLRMKNGNEAFMKWADTVSTRDAIQGVKFDLADLDEDAGSLELLREVYSRFMDCRDEGPWFGAITWSATPEKSSEALENFREDAKHAGKEYSYHNIRASEAHWISAETTAEAVRQQGEMADVKVYGTKTASEVYSVYGDKYDSRRHQLEKDHVIEPSDNLWVSYDPGVDHPTGLLVSAFTPAHPQRVILVKYFNLIKTSVEEEVLALKHYLCGRWLAGWIYDTNAKNQTKETGRSTLMSIMKSCTANGVHIHTGYHQAQKKHEPGIKAVQHYLDPNPEDKSAPPLLMLNPSVESGIPFVRTQLLNAKARKARRAAGDGLLIRGRDEASDCVRYQVARRVAWNRDWQCGGATHKPTPEGRSEPLPLREKTPAEERVERQALLSKQFELLRRTHGRLRRF